MGDANLALYAFNRGIVSPLALARVDVKRLALSAEIQQNFTPRVMGGMMLRPGLQYITSTYLNGASRDIPFVKATDDTAIIELTNLIMRVQVDDAMVTRTAVTTAIANGNMATNLANWTDVDEAGAASGWIAGSHMELTGNGTAAAGRENAVTVPPASNGLEHGIRIRVVRGPVTLRIGTTSGADDLFPESTLGTGYHSLVVTPGTGTMYIRFQSRLDRSVYVQSCEIEAAGVMTLPTPWPDSSLQYVRADAESQSADVLFLACTGYQQRRIERRQNQSWSIVLYAPEDGPFRVENTGPITITASGLTGNITLTASAALFKATQVGALWQLTSTGQTVEKNMAALNDATNSIRVIGVGTDRTVTIIITGMTAGRTVILQRSFDNATWIAVPGQTWAADNTSAYADGLDNQIVYYRLLCSVAGAAGTTVSTLSIPTGSIIGVVRLTGFTNSTTVDAEVLSAIGSSAATDTWAEGQWSDYRGWPTVGSFVESRCAWAGLAGFWASVTDAFESFDPATEGDSGPISRSLGSGPVDTVNLLVPLSRLILGTPGKEVALSSSSLEEPLTPSNFNIKPVSTQGSTTVQALKIDDRAIFVDRGGNRVFEIAADAYIRYNSTDLTVLCPEVCTPTVVRTAVQRKPDTRIHCVLSDGTVAIAIQDRAENVLCWIKLVSDGAAGLIEDVCVLPAVAGDKDDQVYYTVQRFVDGGVRRYREKVAQEDDCQGGAYNLQADSFATGTNSVTGLTHLINREVIAWRDGTCPVDADGNIQTYTVDASGEIDLPGSGPWVVGLPYTARFQSAKLGWMPSSMGTSLAQLKLITGMALIMRNVHPKGLKYGQDFDIMDDLPQVEAGAVIDPDEIRVAYDEQSFEFPGSWDTDSRLCLEAQAPRPVTVLAAVISTEEHEG